jgi:peroxiredoxin
MKFQSLMSELGSVAPPFALPDPAGRIYRMEDFAAADALLIAFMCNHCPFVLHILDSFVRLAADFAPRGVATVAISSNDVATHPEDGPRQMADLAQRRDFSFPYLYDEAQSAAIQFGAVCKPDFFVYDRERRLYYRGQFDGTRPTTEHTRGRPGAGSQPTGADMRAALDALLNGKAAPAEQRPSMGCSMKWKPGNEPEWG